MKEISLPSGQSVLLDDEDFNYLNQFKWKAHKAKHTIYASRNIKVSGKWKTILMHRVILNLNDKNTFTDHIDLNGLNNQKHNLRIANRSQNNANRKSTKNSSSKFLGVFFNKKTGKWYASVRKDNKHNHLGYFFDEIEAAKAYNEAAKIFHGEFANLNIF